ncbi:acyl-CoA thioesterase [Kribbella sp. CA-247076]|uniref:acyl-CoA thioesterase n=1 Tax=Kribbella sp. CA-247076 TaxID=3239941 RepID=UPI003D8E78D0
MSSTPSSRPTSVTRLSLSHITAQNETNLLGTVHGGVVMTLVDSVAGVVAARHSGGPAVTASMDEMTFLVPVRVGDVVHFSGQVNWTGRSSMEVGVRITADRWDSVGPEVHVASAYLVFVAVDADGKPREVPQVVPETDEDRRRLREAEIRRSHRLARRAAIVASREEESRERAASEKDASEPGVGEEEAREREVGGEAGRGGGGVLADGGEGAS